MAGARTGDAFSLTERGPADRLLARLGIPGGELPRLLVRAFLPALAVWVPIALLAAFVPPAGEPPDVGFTRDLATHVRFLVFVPLLVLIEASIGRRTRLVARQFAEAGLVTASDGPRFQAELQRCSRAIESPLAEAALAALAAAFVVTAVRAFESDGVLFWYEEAGPGGVGLSTAGWWYAIGSLLPPFLLLRWAWRYLAWCWFLFRVSRLDLALVATHPDRAGGLEFVAFGHASFAGLAFAVSCLVAGAMATRVLQEGMSLLQYRWALAVYAGLAILAGIAPLAVFWRPLRVAREAGILAYGSFAARYAQDFQGRWIGTEQGKAPLEASGDVQGLADIGGSLERVYALRVLPVSVKTVLTFAGASVAPMLPLLLLVMPLRDLLKLLMQALI